MKKIYLLFLSAGLITAMSAQAQKSVPTQKKDSATKIVIKPTQESTRLMTPQPKAAPQKQQPAVKEIDPEIKELTAARDTAKAALRIKTSENRKDINHYDRMYNKNKTMKDQLKTAQKDKKTDKADDLKEKVDLTTDSLKELDAKIKSDTKDLKNLQKELDKAEVDLEKAKDRIAKEKKKK